MFRRTAQRGLGTVRHTVSLACVVAAGAATLSAGALGERVDVAKNRQKDYKARYGAVDPIFKTSADGNIVMECWAAPPEMWTKSQALELGKELLPAKLRATQPKPLPKDGGKESFAYGESVTLVLSAFKDRYTQVEVRAKGYSGSWLLMIGRAAVASMPPTRTGVEAEA